jgi:rhamnose utilization protein RhaD (predicted bifunctional aldolase and dehydrogenase)/NAD(P)-dependent dehydrogenase (short-subunit alcohol dehydrogenase family)
MQNLWNDADAPVGDLEQRVYTSRLLGRDPSLVLHGGGNTSVKLRQPDLLGREQDILYVKGSGRDLETIDASGFSPLRIAPLLELATLPALSDARMANELRCALIDASAPNPSVEAILHALIPHKFVDHTHADSLLAITHTEKAAEHLREIYGDDVAVLPYVMPGFQLARQVYEALPSLDFEHIQGIVLLNHGIFTFGATARESYDRMIELVTRAQRYFKQHPLWDLPTTRPVTPIDLAALRQNVSQVAGFPVILSFDDGLLAQSFTSQRNLWRVAGQGPATPDHVIRTKRLPLLGTDVAAYRDEYVAYFRAHQNRATSPLTMLDPAPRIILAGGVISVGRTARDAEIAADIYRHTIEIILRAQQLGGYTALPAADYFDVEYWELEQAKLKGVKLPPFAGEIALVTGAASGIGRAAAESLLARGAAVVALDLNPAVESLMQRPDFVGIRCDVTDEAQIAAALQTTLKRFGGLDMLVLNAGIFPKSAKIEALATAEWDKVMRVNLDSNLILMREAHPLLKRAPNGGRVVIVGSKNVPAPGAGAAAYSASKAALTQLARVAAFEWGADGIRINIVHPNAVFDTGIWTEDVLQARAKSYSMTVEEYKTNNVLGVEVTSHDVGELVAEMCGATFAKTTGAQVPIDGGNDRVI